MAVAMSIPIPGYKINRTFWNGDDLPDRTILFHAEHGLRRYPAIHPLRPDGQAPSGPGRGALPDAAAPAARPMRGGRPGFRRQALTSRIAMSTPLVSLPAIFGTTLETVPAQVPYLTTDPVLVEHWRSVLAETIGDRRRRRRPTATASRPARPFLIGIAWQGNPANHGSLAIVSAGHFAPLAELPGVRLISLQVDHGLDQLDAASRSFPSSSCPADAAATSSRRRPS